MSAGARTAPVKPGTGASSGTASHERPRGSGSATPAPAHHGQRNKASQPAGEAGPSTGKLPFGRLTFGQPAADYRTNPRLNEIWKAMKTKPGEAFKLEEAIATFFNETNGGNLDGLA